MKKKLLATIVAVGTVISGCSGSKDATKPGAGGEKNMSGVAAVGAPISNGFVEVKGANGAIVSTTTNASGVYGVALGSLVSPYLVRVTSPSGQRFFTVASKEDVSASKKINITPITHTIVANLFKDKSPDTLFDNFTTKSNAYSQSAIDTAKESFKQKMIDAGVLGSDGVLTDENIDLMNGSFVAGSGVGVDKLLDALEIDVEKGASNIEVNLKSGDKIYSNDVSDPTKQVTITKLTTAITNTSSQLVLLDQIKESLNNINKIFKKVSACSGPVVAGGDCDKDLLNELVIGMLHPDYKYSGITRSEDSWAYFCTEDKVDGKEEANSTETCKFINSEVPSFSDIVVLDIQDNNIDAMIQFSFYLNGKFEGTIIEKVSLSVDDNDINNNDDKLEKVWKFKGNQLNHQYFFEPLSLHKTIISSEKTEQIYEAQIQLYASELQASLGTDISLKAVNKDGSSNTVLNLALGGGLTGLLLTSDANSLSKLHITANRFRDYSSGAIVSTSCEACGENFDSNKISLNEAALQSMDAVQRFELKYKNGATETSEMVYIRRPMKITANNASKLVPSFSSKNICESFSTSYPILKPASHTFNYGSVYLYNIDENISLINNEPTEGKSSIEIASIGENSGKKIDFGYFNLSSVDSLGRMFSRDIECKK